MGLQEKKEPGEMGKDKILHKMTPLKEEPTPVKTGEYHRLKTDK
jgi:hypothetical protein